MMARDVDAPRLAAAWLWIALVAAIIAACSAEPGSTERGPPGRGVYIGTEWRAARAVLGHEKHVVRQKIPCSKCHEIEADRMGPVTPEKCAECHPREARIEHAARLARERFGSDVKADCTVCHAFRPTTDGHHEADGGTSHPPPASACNRCHGEAQGDTPAVRIHGTSECVQCHRPHDDAQPRSAPCTDCHQDVETTHAPKASVVETCATCHTHQHAPGSDALGTCVPCHASTEPKVPATALFADGHTACVGCHRSHDLRKETATECRACHEDVIVLGARRVREHARCTSCHDAHDVRGSPDQACLSCHADKKPNHPRHGVAGTCVGCHDVHPSRERAHDRVRDCSTCHQVAASDEGFHGGTGCRQCHQPHDFVRPVSDRTACRECHAAQIDRTHSLAGHQACEGCHGGLPHRPTKLQVGCETCHAGQHEEATIGHRECTSCHEPHAGTVGTECRTCHADEHRTAPEGHRACRDCHEQHSGATKAQCTTCHTAEAKTHHARVDRGCTTCHRPHGPQGVSKPPACSSCHATATLAGLHQVVRHQDCGRCHTGHGEAAPRAAREECLGCHVDRKTHFPEAPHCASCHLFGPTR